MFKTNTNLIAMVARDGDVALVPEPETYLMLLTGLGLIGAVTRRRRLGIDVKTIY